MITVPFNGQWNGALSNRLYTKYIVLHHASAVKYSFEQCHQGHLNQGWSGIGYHFYITKDGTIYEGRPINKMGAQVSGFNDVSIGICAEGNYDTENSMPEKQLQSIAEVLEFCKNKYPNAQIVGHKELKATACPGKYYPLEKLKNYKEVLNPKEMLQELEKIKTQLPKVYKTLDDIPEYYRATIEKIVNKGFINGTGKGELNLTEDICRLLVILERAGVL